MDKWSDIISARSTTFSWTDELIPKEVIQEVCEEVHLFCPSKNRKIPYIVNVIRNTDYDQRKALHTGCHRNTDRTIEEDGGNPQVLAPTLLVFSKRDVTEAETKFQTIEKRVEDGIANTDNIEIGMAALSFLYGLTSRGWDTGLCQCVRSRSGTARLLGTNGSTDLIIGVGRRNTVDSETGETTTWPKYMDPRNDKHRKIPYPYGISPYPKPNFDDIYKIEF